MADESPAKCDETADERTSLFGTEPIPAYSDDETRPPQAERGSSDASGDETATRQRRRRPAQARRRRPNNDDDDEEENVRHSIDNALLVVPVSICMLVVIATVLSVTTYQNSSGNKLIYLPYDETDSSGGSQFGQAIINASVFIGIVVVMTVVLVILYKKRCYKVLHGWLILTTVALVFFFSGLYLVNILEKYNKAMDWFTFAMILWNFGIMGMFAIHWKGPLRVQQAYHIFISALLALIFIQYLPDWTTWVLLAFFVVYDLLAVLCPKGPLRILVETAAERNENIFPSLIYSSTMLWTVTMADNEGGGGGGGRKEAEDDEEDSDGDDDGHNNEGSMTESQRHTQAADRLAARSDSRRPQSSNENNEQPKRGAKLGLGDFIFYSLLLGKAASDSGGDWNVILACYISILMGLCLTLLWLLMRKKALPALPISITFGIIFYFATSGLISPFVSAMAKHQVFM
ncbi:presenilin-2-like [Oscarella lobularis]|uniref:presenilin-2-like n=1 Tax=Oscarella lobularis TaxID=121494 RepID=UPI0033138FFE